MTPVFALLLAVVGGLTGDEVEASGSPNEGMRRSAQSALIAWLGIGLPAAALVGIVERLNVGQVRLAPVIAPMMALPWGLGWGGRDILRHLVLRILFWLDGFAPWNYIRFLDCAAERIFLRKVGGGYIFIHRLLQDYFASLDEGDAEKLAS